MFGPSSTAPGRSLVRGQPATVGPPALLLGPGDEREPRPLLDPGQPVGSADRVELERELGQGMELILPSPMR
jgi:hypothetical protein